MRFEGDRGSYELTENSRTALSIPAPLWLLHLGGLQPAYDDATLEAIQSSGGSISTDVREVMQRIGTQPTLGKGTSLLSVVDDYAWFLSKTPDLSAKPDEAFAPIAARQWVTQVTVYQAQSAPGARRSAYVGEALSTDYALLVDDCTSE